MVKEREADGMARELLLMRSGKVKTAAERSPCSYELTGSGKRGAQRIGTRLAETGIGIGQVLCAPRPDALVTAQKLVKSAGMGVDRIIPHDDILAADLDVHLNLLARQEAGDEPLLCVGPRDFVMELTGYLVGCTPVDCDAGDLLRLRLPNLWSELSEGCGELLGIVRHKQLPPDFPYPFPDGQERRSRPAYYYSQSAVLPFRYRKGSIEVLLITNGKRSRWGVPKGIHEPGLTSADSAAKEAYEEAGIRGIVGTTPIGLYFQDKWGAQCRIELYPMEVIEYLPLQEWPENHRLRRWFSPKDAIGELHNPELASIVSVFATQQT